MDAFERLHPALKHQLWDMQWSELRPIQVSTIHHVLDDRGDCIISVPTAEGKTEAAFLPILSRAGDASRDGVWAMYVGPLKALINDQFRRLEDLCARLEIDVHKWHGDVGQGARKRLLGRPGGVLLITPESLEAMFVLRSTRLPAIFGRLAYVVIDELHAFMGTERGAQLRSQLDRLRRRCGCDPVRIGLSATISDPAGAARWLRPNASMPATILQDAAAERGLQIRVRGLWQELSPLTVEEGDEARTLAEREEAMRISTIRAVAAAMLVAVRGTTTLVFANAKAIIETLADALKEAAREMGLQDEVVVHHGSLSKELREYAEARLNSRSPCVAVCSNTLELGIDVGDVDGVVQFAAPPSVAALVQRIGRSGRRGGPARMRGFFVAQRPDVESSPWESLQLDFLRGLAMTELMLAKFLEPIRYDRAHASTLVQQILSMLAEHGGLPAATLHDALQQGACFGDLTKGRFAELLRALARHDLLEQMPQGDLILAPTGLKIVEHHDFYAAFKSTEEVTVSNGPDRIGTLPANLVPPVGDHLILGGRRWRVLDVDSTANEVLVEPSVGRRPPVFSSARVDVHATVHERMRSLATGADVPAYLDEGAVDILRSLRRVAAGFSAFSPAMQSNQRSTRLFLWAGSCVARTVQLGLWCMDDALEVTGWDVGLEIAANVDTALERLRSLARAWPSSDALAALAARRLGALATSEKYAPFLPDGLWTEIYGREQLDIAAAQRTVEAVLTPDRA